MISAEKCDLNNIEVIVFGQHCWNTLGQIRSFGDFGVNSHVIWIENDDFTPKGSKYVRTFHSCLTFEEGFNYLINTFNNSNKKYIVSTDSDRVVQLLNENYNKLKDQYFFFNAGEQCRLSKYMSKKNQLLIAEKFGLNVPKTEFVKNGELSPGLDFPIFTKSKDSFSFNWKKNCYICKNIEDLKKAYEQIPDEELILQKYIKKDNEVAIEGISYNNGQNVFMPIQGEYLRIEDGSFGTWKKNEIYKLGDDLREKIHNILLHIRYNGIFEIEFLKDKNGELYFLEINFRHTQYNNALTIMGVNFCQLYYQSVLYGIIDIEDLDIKSPSITMNEYKEYRKYIKTGLISITEWIRDIRKTDSFYFYDKKDKKYFYRNIARLIKEKLQSYF